MSIKPDVNDLFAVAGLLLATAWLTLIDPRLVGVEVGVLLTVVGTVRGSRR